MQAHWGTKSFREYFCNSAVVTPEGDPKVVYHATPNNFDIFARGDIGFHFGTKLQASIRHELNEKKETAKQSYLTSKEIAAISPSGRTIPVYLAITHPIRMKDVGAWDDPFQVAGELMRAGWINHSELRWLDASLADSVASNHETYEQSEPIRDLFQRKRWDGIIYENKYEIPDEGEDPDGSDSWIALWPWQVKSVFGNRGTYSRSEGCIWK